MRKIVLISLAAALFMPALSAQAEPAAQTSTQTAGQPRDRDGTANPDRQICVTERLSGSHVPRRVCRTAREWQLLQDDGSDDR